MIFYSYEMNIILNDSHYYIKDEVVRHLQKRKKPFQGCEARHNVPVTIPS